MVTISGGDKLAGALKDLSAKVAQRRTLRVGFLEDATYPDGTSVAQVAAMNNFGTSRAPPRPFFSNMVATEGPSWGEKLARILDANDFDSEKALELMGEGISGQLRDAIVSFNGAPLSPVTLLLRARFPMGGYEPDDVWKAFRDAAAGVTEQGSSKQLVWTGHMLNSVDYEVGE